MELVNKFQEIIRLQKVNADLKICDLNQPINEQQIIEIEKLLGEPLPQEFLTLYSFANGQVDNSGGVLFGHRFMDAVGIARQLEISLSFLKPEIKKIVDKEKSGELLKKIVDFYVEHTPKRNFLGIKKKWYKIEFQCGIDTFGGPYLYPNEHTTENEREIIAIDFKKFENISKIISEIHSLEKESYNWDQLEFVVFFNGEFNIERTFFDFDNQIQFTSIPENAIRKKYFNYKWLPLFSDYGGNYIGIDLDPDTNGKKGQIINFGRDEEIMVVLADSLEEFFDFILIQMSKPGNKLLNSAHHLHDTLKEFKN